MHFSIDNGIVILCLLCLLSDLFVIIFEVLEVLNRDFFKLNNIIKIKNKIKNHIIINNKSSLKKTNSER